VIITVDSSFVASSDTGISPIDLLHCGLRTSSWDINLRNAGYRRVSEWTFRTSSGEPFSQHAVGNEDGPNHATAEFEQVEQHTVWLEVILTDIGYATTLRGAGRVVGHSVQGQPLGSAPMDWAEGELERVGLQVWAGWNQVPADAGLAYEAIAEQI
jgi:hypothetical protein